MTTLAQRIAASRHAARTRQRMAAARGLVSEPRETPRQRTKLRLTGKQFDEIVRRYMAGESGPVIARDYGVRSYVPHQLATRAYPFDMTARRAAARDAERTAGLRCSLGQSEHRGMKA